MSQTTIEAVKVKDIYDFACETLPQQADDDIAPISKSRAAAWTKNPHADEEDVALLVAREDDRVAGYLGFMQGKITAAGEEEKVHWLSTFYVPPERRDSGLGAMLLMRAIGLNQTLAACGSSDSAVATYRALRFAEPPPLAYFQSDLFRKNVLGAPVRMLRKLWRKCGRESRVLDWAVARTNAWNKRFLYALISREMTDAKTRIGSIDDLDKWNFEHDQDHKHPFRFLRDKSVLEWMLREQWVTEDPTERQPNYYFDDFRKEFDYRIVEVQSPTSGEPLGFVILWILQRDEVRDVRVLDYHFQSDDDRKLIAAVAIQAAREVLADRIFLPDVCADQIAQSKWASQWFEKKERPCFVRPRNGKRELAEQMDQIALHYCDGDIPFA